MSLLAAHPSACLPLPPPWQPFTDSLKEYFARRTDQVQWLVEHEMVGLPDSLSPAAAELASNNAVAARHLLEVANKMGRDKSLASGGTSGEGAGGGWVASGWLAAGLPPRRQVDAGHDSRAGLGAGCNLAGR